MQPFRIRFWHIAVPLMAVTLAVALAACSQPQPTGIPSGDADAKAADQAVRKASDAADRLAQAMQPPPADTAQPPPADPDAGVAPVPEVLWIEKTPPPANVAPAKPAAQANPVKPPAPPVAKAGPAAPAKPVAAAPVTAVSPRRQLIDQLAADIRASRESDLTKALTLAGVALADDANKLNDRDLSPLNDADRQTVQRFQTLVSELARDLAARESRLDADAIARRLDSLFGRQPVGVRRVKLCKRVKGYGVYEPFEKYTFLAGREQPVIVYVEVDNFSVAKTDKPLDAYQVKLTQEVVLFNEVDGLAVWKQTPVEILDESRNHRRDFFLVQLVRLPARLSVGKYVLKIRITDGVNGSVGESTVAIDIVADHALVQGGR